MHAEEASVGLALAREGHDLAIDVAHARRVHEALVAAGLRSQLDERSETLGFKIREAETSKVPLMLVIGDQEDENGTAMPRLRRSKRKLDALAVDDLVARLARAREERAVQPFADETPR